MTCWVSSWGTINHECNHFLLPSWGLLIIPKRGPGFPLMTFEMKWVNKHRQIYISTHTCHALSTLLPNRPALLWNHSSHKPHDHCSTDCESNPLIPVDPPYCWSWEQELIVLCHHGSPMGNRALIHGLWFMPIWVTHISPASFWDVLHMFTLVLGFYQCTSTYWQ